MRHIITILFVGIALFTALSAGGDKPAQVFSGTYDWKDGGSGELKAEFRPTGEGSWSVKFSFRFGGKRNSWKGISTGSLEDGGEISGTVEWRGRTWVFEGTVEAGVLRGSHTEIQRGGKRYDTGSFEMIR